MSDEILLIGRHTRPYLYSVVNDLQQCGFICNVTHESLEGTNKNLFVLTINDYADTCISMQCRCHELNFIATEKELSECTDLLRQAKHIIVVLPIKFFASYRYNVDDHFTEVENWINPDWFQRIMHHTVLEKNASLSWVVTGTEQVTRMLTNHSLIKELSSIGTSKSVSDFQQKASEAVKLFFSENEEKSFLSQCEKDKGVSFGFFRRFSSSASEIGEKTCTLWNAHAFWVATQNTSLPESIFAHL